MNKVQLKFHRFYKPQRGLSLIESLIALVVLAVGVMGLAGLQARMLVESRTANHRAVAIGFIDDLSNRMLLNRDAAMANSYTLAWNGTKAKKDCTTAPCTGADLAQSDLNLWRLALQDALPNANANIFPSATDPRQIGIAVAWSANERITNKTDTKYNKPFEVTKNGVLGTDCPAFSICHVVYVQP
jgi:type IV pilus assembly protein PilV